MKERKASSEQREKESPICTIYQPKESSKRSRRATSQKGVGTDEETAENMGDDDDDGAFAGCPCDLTIYVKEDDQKKAEKIPCEAACVDCGAARGVERLASRTKC